MLYLLHRVVCNVWLMYFLIGIWCFESWLSLVLLRWSTIFLLSLPIGHKSWLWLGLFEVSLSLLIVLGQRFSLFLGFVFGYKLWLECQILIFILLRIHCSELLFIRFLFSGILMHSLSLCFAFAQRSLCSSSWIWCFPFPTWSLNSGSLWCSLHRLKLRDRWFALVLLILLLSGLLQSLFLQIIILYVSSGLAHVLEEDEYLVHLFWWHVEFRPSDQIFNTHQLLHQMCFWFRIGRLLDLLHVIEEHLII